MAQVEINNNASERDSEDVVLSALNMAQDFASKVDLILSKLSQLVKRTETQENPGPLLHTVFALKIEKTSFLANATSIASRISVLAQIYLSR